MEQSELVTCDNFVGRYMHHIQFGLDVTKKDLTIADLTVWWSERSLIAKHLSGCRKCKKILPSLKEILNPSTTVAQRQKLVSVQELLYAARAIGMSLDQAEKLLKELHMDSPHE